MEMLKKMGNGERDRKLKIRVLKGGIKKEKSKKRRVGS
jgi:hypothetical protein